MNEQDNPSTTNHAETSGKAAYRFMAAKKEPPPASEPGNTTFSTDNIPEDNLQQEAVADNKPKERERRNKRSGISLNYIDTFLSRYELSSRQGLHLEKETIATIKRIIHSIGDERLTVSGFVENVLKHHFETYKEEVNRLYDEKLRKPIE